MNVNYFKYEWNGLEYELLIKLFYLNGKKLCCIKFVQMGLWYYLAKNDMHINKQMCLDTLMFKMQPWVP